MEKRVTGIGGIFFKTEDPDGIRNWYRERLGLDTNQWGCSFEWKDKEGKDASTQWSPFPKDTNYFKPSQKEFMMNFRVENLEKLLETLSSEGVQVVGEMQTYDYGKFGWIMDPDGNKIELWEPVDSAS